MTEAGMLALGWRGGPGAAAYKIRTSYRASTGTEQTVGRARGVASTRPSAPDEVGGVWHRSTIWVSRAGAPARAPPAEGEGIESSNRLPQGLSLNMAILL